MDVIKRSIELDSHVMTKQQRAFMKRHNENPKFENTQKPYNFLKHLKTNTDVHGWSFEYNGEFYTATQNLMWRGGENVQIYKSNKRGELMLSKKVKTMLCYCDIETAIDDWIKNDTSNDGNQ